MKTTATFALACLLAAAAAPTAARAAVNVNVQVGLPAAPPLVVVQPGVQVVEDFHEEVFYTSGFYWVRRDGGWYRARQPRARFVFAEPRYVPVALVRMPRGQYVRYKKENHGHSRAKEEKRERKHGHGHDRDGERGEHGRGHGHGHDD